MFNILVVDDDKNTRFVMHELLEAERFTVAEAANGADVDLKIVEKRMQSPDHPALVGFPETEYLKFYICKI